ncbi:MAG: MerR family transcriptional regulator [Actinomycetia bacterium]|nr:MerR family transcriptional regulator [Actinomycetes bacterium]
MTGDAHLDIGEVVELSGVPASTLHVWEKAGLLAPVGRKGLRRQYAGDVLERIAVVVVCQRAGFTLNEITDLVAPDAFAQGKAQIEYKLDELRHRQTELAEAIEGLEHALVCSEPSPLDCDGFRSKLSGVLPVRR